MSTKALALLVAILGLAVLSGCGGEPQAEGEPTSGSPAAGVGEEVATSGPRTEDGADPKGGGETLTLEVGGSSGTEFFGTCAVGDGGPEELGDRAPQNFTYDLRGEALECEITSEGDLEVTLTHDGTCSVQRVSAGTLKLDYENGSISSSISSPSSSSQVGSSSSGTIGEQPAGATDASGSVAIETRDVSGFDEVELRGIGSLSVRQTGTESLTVEAEEDVLPKIGTEVVDGRLVIGPEPNTSIETTEPINYELTVDDLRALKASGSGDIDAQSISTGELAVTISGTANVETNGRAESQEVNVSGSGDYKAQDLESRRVQIGIEGTGSAVVNASEELNAKVGGTGSVEYEGNPTVNQDVSGVGQVSKH